MYQKESDAYLARNCKWVVFLKSFVYKHNVSTYKILAANNI
jgi:hypothetical protein